MRALLGLLVALSLGGCKSKEKPAAAGAPAESAAAAPAPPLQPVGMVDPFARLAGETAKALQKGYKAQKAKKWDEAQAAFRAVIAAAPDYTPARWQLVRVLVAAGQLAAVPAEFEALIARDFVGYAHALDAKKEFAALRAAPEWQKIGALVTAYHDAYAKGLDRGFCFIARTRAAVEPKLGDGASDAKLDLKQEVFQYDPDAQRFRRLTDTGGHAFALARSPSGAQLAFLVASALHEEGGTASFVDPQVGVISLTTLETVGPFTAKGRFAEAALTFDKAAMPLFSFTAASEGRESVSFTFDSAKTGLAKLDAPGAADGGETHATPDHVSRSAGKTVAGVKLADGANQFSIDGVAQPVVAARPLEPASLDWSPGRARITYAGRIDACAIVRGQSKEKNELFVFDVGKKSAQRIAAAISAFETLWLDDDKLVYEGGVGKDGTLHLYAFDAHADTALPTRYGAGLYGVPTLTCEAEEAGADSTEPATDETDSN